MPHIDQIVLGSLVAGLLASIVYQWRRGLRGRRLVGGVFGLFYGVTLVVMLGCHCVDVLYGLAHHAMSMSGKPFAYDWRTYSLLLFGVMLVRQGVGCARAAVRLGPGATAARADVLRRATLVAAIVLPLVPIHAFFGYLIGGASLLTIAAVALGCREALTVPAASLDREAMAIG